MTNPIKALRAKMVKIRKKRGDRRANKLINAARRKASTGIARGRSGIAKAGKRVAGARATAMAAGKKMMKNRKK